MNLTSSKPIRLSNDTTGVELIVAVPIVAQIEELLELEPADEAARAREGAGAKLRRQLRQTEILLSPPKPDAFSLFAWLAWRKQARAARRFLARLEYRQQVQMFNIIYAAAQGVNLDELMARAQESAEKKTTGTGTRPAPACAPAS